MPNQYRGSQAQQTIVVLRTYATTTTIGAYGSEDGFAAPRTEFGDDEEIIVAGTVRAADNTNLTGIAMTVLVDGGVVGTTLLYGYDGTTNYYQLSLGRLSEGTHVVEATFPRIRK